MIRKFTAKIKEKGKDHILTPVYWGYEFTTLEFVEDFWGVHNPDVESYEIKVEEIDE